jgi:tetratricopeptide (TPR) repeat protein
MAQAWYLASASLQPKNVDAWLKASTVLFENSEQNFEIAENCLLQGIMLNPNNSLLTFNMGVVLHATGRLQEAVTFYDEALRLDSSLQGAVANLATALHALGQFNEALPLYEKSLQENPGNAVLLGNFAVLLNSLNKPIAAYTAIERAVTLDPQSVDLQTTRTSLLKTISAARLRVRSTQLAVTEAVMKGDWNNAMQYLEIFGEPEENRVWWYFGTGMTSFFRYQVHYCV